MLEITDMSKIRGLDKQRCFLQAEHGDHEKVRRNVDLCLTYGLATHIRDSSQRHTQGEYPGLLQSRWKSSEATSRHAAETWTADLAQNGIHFCIRNRWAGSRNLVKGQFIKMGWS